jgi:hypothetical protein
VEFAEEIVAASGIELQRAKTIEELLRRQTGGVDALPL